MSKVHPKNRKFSLDDISNAELKLLDQYVRAIAQQEIYKERNRRNRSLHKTMLPFMRNWNVQLKGKTKLTKLEKIKKRLIDLNL